MTRSASPTSRTVVLEMLGLVPGEVGGMETYARNLVDVLPTLDERYRFVAAVGREAQGVAGRRSDAVTEWVADGEGRSWMRQIRPARTLAQSLALARQLRRWSPDVVHCLMMFPKPPWGAPNMVVTIHDLNFELFPDHWSLVDRRVMSAACRYTVKTARAIVTVSEFSKRTLVERYGAAPHRIHVTPHGVRHDVFSPDPDPHRGAALRRKLDLPQQVLFFPANTWPHKNHLRLLEALAAVRDNDDLRPGLVLTGSPKAAHAELLRGVTRLGLERQVRWLGHVDQARLVALYRTSTALVCPSLHEGFGMPIVEAMASGCPVVCARTTGTGETAGDAALTVDPTDVADIARGIRTVLGDERLREELANRGLKRAAEFSWERAGRDTLRVYDEVIGSRRSEGGTRD